MTKFMNTKPKKDAGDVNNWIHKNLTIPKGTRVSVMPTYDGTEIEELDIATELSVEDKAKLVAQYPELAGKEVN